MNPKTCLRCDWQGETEERGCPNCGEQPLYVVGGSPWSGGTGAVARSDPQEWNPAAASMAPSGTLSSESDPAPSSMDAVEPSKGSRRSSVAFVLVATVLTFAMGSWLNAHEERSAPAASTDAATLNGVSPEPVVPHTNGSLVRIDAATGAIVGDMPIQFPKLLASDGHSVWVFDEGTPTTPRLVRVDAQKSGRPKAFDVALPDSLVTVGGVEVATALAATRGRVWLRDDAGGVYVVAPGARSVEPTTIDALGSIDTGMVGDGDSLWVPTHPAGPCCTGPSDLQQVDTGTGKVVAWIEGAGQVVASGTGFVWVAVVDTHAHDPGPIVRIDTETHATKRIGPLHYGWVDMAVADGSVWASSFDDDTIVRLDPGTGNAEDWIRLEGAPGALATGGGAVWAAIGENGTVVRYDVGTGRLETTDVGGTPNDLVYANGSIWVSVLGSTGLTVAPGPIGLDLRTGGATRLAESLASGTGFAASSDGTELAYVDSDDEGTQQIFIARIDGTEVRQVTHDPTGATSPAWSPDGGSIAYLGHEHYLAVLDLATGESTGILRVPEPGFQFAPDGSSLVFTGGTPTFPELRSVPVTGGKSTLLFRLSDGLNDSGNGSLSPDGSLVTFIGSGRASSDDPSHCGPCRFVSNADGTERRVIPNCNWNPAGAWSPDGSRIVCSEGGNRIVVVDIATGDATPVADGGAAIWIDRHTLLVEVSSPRVSSTDGLTRTVAGVRFSLGTPSDGWVPGPIKQTEDDGRSYISKSIVDPQDAEAIIFWTSISDDTYVRPCGQWWGPPDGSVAAWAAHASKMRGTELVRGPSGVTVGGFPAEQVVLVVRRNLGCDPGFFYRWRAEPFGPSWMETDVGDTIRLWIVDVYGTRLIIEAETTARADADLKAEIWQIIGSIRFG